VAFRNLHLICMIDTVDESLIATVLEETVLEVVDLSNCSSAHDQLVKSAKFHQRGC